MHIFKVLLCGDGGVGKTSIRRSYLGRSFKKEYISTMGADFALTEINLSSGQKCRFAIWDIAGQEIFENLRPFFYSGAFGACILYDITRQNTYESVFKWVEDFCNYHNLESFPIILLANKIDLRDEAGLVSTSKGEELAKNITIKYYKDNWDVPFIETSAKDGINVKKAFTILADSVVKFRTDIDL